MSRADEPFVRAMVAGLSNLEQNKFPFGKLSGQSWFEDNEEALRLALTLNNGIIQRRCLIERSFWVYLNVNVCMGTML